MPSLPPSVLHPSVGNHRTPQAKTAKVQDECVSGALASYNPEIVKITKEATFEALKKREAGDNEVAAQKGLKSYTLLGVEFNDGAGEKGGGHMGWYYVTLAVGGEIRPHMETGLHHAIMDGKVNEMPTRGEYFVAGALKESEADYVFNNVGFSSASDMYSLPVSAEVLERAQKTLAELGGAKAPGNYPMEAGQNAGRIDNAPDNGKPKEERPTGRISVKEKLAEKKTLIENGNRAGKEIYDKGAEKRAQQGI